MYNVGWKVNGVAEVSQEFTRLGAAQLHSVLLVLVLFIPSPTITSFQILLPSRQSNSLHLSSDHLSWSSIEREIRAPRPSTVPCLDLTEPQHPDKILRKCRYVSERADNASLIHRNPESLQLIGCCVLPLVGMDLLDKRTIF
ncbi:hypothetical protein EYF80_053442 [Liparis tanakae]|uniref:Uncharacterized protein n=1 Tax=Liparis tanakae TaxID=230148 RepID=A0A4Z2F5K9_9TELE|nr:hypothetical protein EYF80_053442 [Liparis tanakae]